jgi:hypothetical protein
MKKGWKWVIGIAIALVVIAGIVGGFFLVRSHIANEASIVKVARPGVQVPGYGFGERFPGMRTFSKDGWGLGGRHMRGSGMMGFGGRMPFAGLFGGLLCLGFLTLVVLGIIWLVRRGRKPVAVAAPVAQVAVAHPCQNCGQAVQAGWKHCPNCGTAQ